MNIQGELQKIHSKYGTSEKANYEIQKLFDKQIRKSDFLACHFAKHIINMPNNKLESETVKKHYTDFKSSYEYENSSHKL